MQTFELAQTTPPFASTAELRLYTRYEHGNRLVRVYRDGDGMTRYECAGGVFDSARGLLRELYGHEVSITFDRYFRLGRYRRPGRASGAGDILTLLGGDGSTISVDGFEGMGRRTGVVIASGAEVKAEDPVFLELLSALDADLKHANASIRATPEMVDAFDRSFSLALDRLEGRVGIDLGEKSLRSNAKTRADEVRSLLWAGFAGKMLSQGYDPEDVLQEVYRGLLVRDNGKCPWDARKSTFGHYVHMVVSCILTNYHRKQVRRVDRDALSLDAKPDGGERVDDGRFGSCAVWSGSDLGDRMALEALAKALELGGDESPEGRLGKAVLSLVASGHTRGEIAREVGQKPAMISRALTWLRKATSEWAAGDALVPARYRTN